MRTKTALSPTTILRPECGAEAPTFLSAVYNQRYTSEKVASRYKQNGRSMIEMLGVLAVIGMLTVGSIAGYSKAMLHHRLNIQREQISTILYVAKTHYDILNPTRLSPSGATFYFGPIFESFDWIPEKMTKTNDSYYFFDIFKNFLALYTQSFYMGFAMNIRKDAYEQCINIYQAIKPFSDFLWITEVYITDQEGGPIRTSNVYHGEKTCINGRTCLKNLTLDQIRDACYVCKDKYKCTFYVLWR